MKPGSKKRCVTKRCNNHANASGGKCWTCYNRARRAADPEARAYHDLKQNVKKRNKKRNGPPINFDLTLPQFRKWCRKTKYIKGAGRYIDSATIDRKNNDPAIGYTEGNIQKLSRGANSSKGSKMLNYDWQTRTAFVTNYSPSEPNTGADNPF